MDNQKLRKGLWLLVIILGCCGCTQHYADPELNAKPRFKTLGPHDVEAVVNQQVDTRIYMPLVYLKINTHGAYDPDTFKRYMLQAFKDFDFFNRVETLPTIQYINLKPPAPKMIAKRPWFEVNDPLSYQEIYERYGEQNFLIAELSLRQLELDNQSFKNTAFSLKLIDPRTEKVLFFARRNAKDWFGTSLSIVNPVLNMAHLWLSYSATHAKAQEVRV